MMDINAPHDLQLLLPTALERKATELASVEGITLEDFVLLAVVEKIERTKTSAVAEEIKN